MDLREKTGRMKGRAEPGPTRGRSPPSFRSSPSIIPWRCSSSSSTFTSSSSSTLSSSFPSLYPSIAASGTSTACVPSAPACISSSSASASLSFSGSSASSPSSSSPSCSQYHQVSTSSVLSDSATMSVVSPPPSPVTSTQFGILSSSNAFPVRMRLISVLPIIQLMLLLFGAFWYTSFHGGHGDGESVSTGVIVLGSNHSFPGHQIASLSSSHSCCSPSSSSSSSSPSSSSPSWWSVVVMENGRGREEGRVGKLSLELDPRLRELVFGTPSPLSSSDAQIEMTEKTGKEAEEEEEERKWSVCRIPAIALRRKKGVKYHGLYVQEDISTAAFPSPFLPSKPLSFPRRPAVKRPRHSEQQGVSPPPPPLPPAPPTKTMNGYLATVRKEGAVYSCSKAPYGCFSADRPAARAVIFDGHRARNYAKYNVSCVWPDGQVTKMHVLPVQQFGIMYCETPTASAMASADTKQDEEGSSYYSRFSSSASSSSSLSSKLWALNDLKERCVRVRQQANSTIAKTRFCEPVVLFPPPKGRRYKLSICMKTRDQSRYLREWLVHHLLHGVEHFFVYDDSSQEELFEPLRPFVALGLVTYVWWPDAGRRRDQAVYGDCVYRFRSHMAGGWTGMIDVDEFVVVTTAEGRRALAAAGPGKIDGRGIGDGSGAEWGEGSNGGLEGSGGQGEGSGGQGEGSGGQGEGSGGHGEGSGGHGEGSGEHGGGSGGVGKGSGGEGGEGSCGGGCQGGSSTDGRSNSVHMTDPQPCDSVRGTDGGGKKTRGGKGKHHPNASGAADAVAGEQVEPAEEYNPGEFLSLLERYNDDDDVFGVYLPYALFGPSGQRRHPHGLVLESYTERRPLVTPDATYSPVRRQDMKNGKSFVKADRLLTVENAHLFIPTRGYTVALNGSEVRLNHYRVKSFEDFMQQSKWIKRNSREGYERLWKDLGREYSGMQDRYILGFVPRVKEVLDMVNRLDDSIVREVKKHHTTTPTTPEGSKTATAAVDPDPDVAAGVDPPSGGALYLACPI